MKKSFVIILSVCCLLNFSCSKPEHYSAKEEVNNETVLKSYTLSKAITDYDAYLLNHKLPKQNQQVLGTIETLLDYALADGASAWTVFKVASKFVGVGYGAAIGMLGGICGSLYEYIRNNYDFKLPRTTQNINAFDIEENIVSNPMNAYTQYSYSFVGQLHNLYLDSAIYKIENGQMGFSASETYAYLVSKASVEFEIPADSLVVKFPFSEYQKIIDDNVGSLSALEINNLTLSDSIPSYLCDYMNEFFTRVRNPENADYDVAINYANLFIADAETQVGFTQMERNAIQYSLSIFKQSLLYWSSKL
ncbi:MAG: hypothetical protein QM642_00895 [Edaphocola sp.]